MLVIAIAVIIIVKAWLAADTSVSLLCAAAPVCALAMIWGVKWDDIETEIKENFKSMCSPVMILMCVGMLVGTWTISGTIPSLVYYGMQFISPGILLVVTCLIGALMSIMTGTSWGTISTAGVALMGVSIRTWNPSGIYGRSDHHRSTVWRQAFSIIRYDSNVIGSMRCRYCGSYQISPVDHGAVAGGITGALCDTGTEPHRFYHRKCRI